MSDKTNEEKLRILQERLTTIRQKETTRQEAKDEQNKPVAPVFEEDLVSQEKKSSEEKGNFSFFKYFIIFFVLACIGYGVSTIDWKNFKISELFSSGETDTPVVEKETTYYLSEFNVNGEKGFIVLLNSYKNESVAQANIQDIKLKGYEDCGLFYLPGVSDSKEEIYQTFVGPFSNQEEANQWNHSPSINSSGTIIELQ